MLFSSRIRFLVGVSLFSVACARGLADETDASTVDGRIPMPVDAGSPNGPDADLPPRNDAGELAFGPAVVLDDLRLSDTGHSLERWAPLLNIALQLEVEPGKMIVLLEFRRLDDPRGQNDSDLDLGVFFGEDSNGAAADNFSGGAELKVSDASLDAIGNPIGLFPHLSVSGGHLSGTLNGTARLFVNVPSIGTVPVSDAALSADLVPWGTGEFGRITFLVNGRLTGTLRAQDVATIPNPAADACPGATLLDLAVLPCLISNGIQPDVDRDGDGLERFEDADQDGSIDRCYDGDGTLYVSTPFVSCALDPAFDDGFSASLEFAGVRAIILPKPWP